MNTENGAPHGAPAIAGGWQQFECACRLLADNRVEEAKTYLIPAAEAGVPEAMLNLGVLLSRSANRVDTRRGVAWLRMAARLGQAEAAHNLAAHYAERGDWGRARRWFGRALQLGDQEALVEIARLELAHGRDDLATRQTCARVLLSLALALPEGALAPHSISVAKSLMASLD